MFRHCVMFRWNEGVDDATRAAIADRLDGLAELDGVLAYRHGPDAGVSEGNWDYVVVGDFDSMDAYRAYAVDPGHLQLIADLVRPNISARAAVQYHC